MARHHVHVKVEHGLVAFLAVGLQQRQSRRIEHGLHRLRHLLRRLHHGCRFLGRDVEQGGRVALGGHQHVAGIDLAQIHEGQGQIILVDAGGRDITGDQLAEDALAGRGRIDEHGHESVSVIPCG